MEIPLRSSYLASFQDGTLAKRLNKALAVLEKCTLCPHNCGINRLSDELGICKTGRLAKIASYSPHFGEESPLVGSNGSGTIFISSCNLLCVFCQNHDISHDNQGTKCNAEQIAAMMLDLQRQGCHNINFVTPSHVVPQLLEALVLAIPKGLTVPLVYNSSGYDKVETLELIDGIIDIYMPDIKFSSNKTSSKYTVARNYPEVAQKALIEMHRQVGDLKTEQGLAKQGMIIRHLVMPGYLDETKQILRFIADKLSLNTYLNIMDQYRPCGKANQFPEINKSLPKSEYEEAVRISKEMGFTQLDKKNWPTFLRLFTQ